MQPIKRYWYSMIALDRSTYRLVIKFPETSVRNSSDSRFVNISDPFLFKWNPSG